MPWLIAYDVAERRRLQRIHRRMCRHALALEYSVFWLDGAVGDRAACLREVLPLLHRPSDDLRVYAMPRRGLRLRMGVAALAEGIVWTALPGGWWSDSLEAALAREDGVPAAATTDGNWLEAAEEFDR